MAEAPCIVFTSLRTHSNLVNIAAEGRLDTGESVNATLCHFRSRQALWHRPTTGVRSAYVVLGPSSRSIGEASHHIQSFG